MKWIDVLSYSFDKNLVDEFYEVIVLHYLNSCDFFSIRLFLDFLQCDVERKVHDNVEGDVNG